jgi:hypothetical protein
MHHEDDARSQISKVSRSSRVSRLSHNSHHSRHSIANGEPDPQFCSSVPLNVTQRTMLAVLSANALLRMVKIALS